MTWCEGFAIFRERCRIDREQDQEIILLQRVHDRSFGELQTPPPGPALKALFQRVSPLLDGVGTMWQDGKLSLLGAGSLQTNVVLRIRPIDADKGTKDSRWAVRHIVKRTDGGSDAAGNLQMHHLNCRSNYSYAENSVV